MLPENNENILDKKNEKLALQPKFYPEKITFLLKINDEIPKIDSKNKLAENFGLSKKQEFHFTIIGNDTGKEILSILENLDEKEKNKKLTQLINLIDSTDWQATLTNDFYYIQKEYKNPDENSTKEKRQSIIQAAEIENLKEFYQKLDKLFNYNFKEPFPHVTLYTTSTLEDKKMTGIGIYSKEQFDKLNPVKI